MLGKADDPTRRHIVSIATELLRDRSVGRVKLGDVAAACGISLLELRLHFRSMEALFRECLSSAVMDMKEVLYWHSAKSISLSEKLKLISRDMFSLKKNRPGVVRLFLDSDETAKEPFFSEAIEVMRYGTVSGELREGVDTVLAAVMFFGALFVMLDTGMGQELADPGSVTSLLLSGIGT